MISSFLNIFLPVSGPYSFAEGNHLEVVKAKSLQFVNIVALFLALLFIVLRAIVEGQFPPSNTSTIFSLPFFLLSILVLKCKGMFKTSVMLFIIISYLAVTLRIFQVGGLSSANLILYMIFPLCSYVFLGDHKRFYIFYTILCVTTFIVFYLYFPFGVTGKAATEPAIVKLYISIAGFLISVGIIWINDIFKDIQYQRIKKIEKQAVGVKIILAINHELVNPMSILKGGFQIVKESGDKVWVERCENSIARIEEKIVELNAIVQEYGLLDEKLELKSLQSIKKDLDN